jgi:hypothetical protein
MNSNFMRGALKAALLAGAAVAAQSASATILFFEGESPLIDNKVHAFNDASHPTTGLSVYGITDVESALVKFTGNTTISITGGSGYAQIFDANDTLDWNSLTIEMADGSGFSGLEFALQFLNADVSQQSPGTLGITVNYVGGTATKSYADFTSPGNRSFYLYGNAGEVIQSVTLSAAPDRFSQLKQTDIGIVRAPAVPEPATWALLVTGFAAVGSVLRRRKTSVAFA